MLGLSHLRLLVHSTLLWLAWDFPLTLSDCSFEDKYPELGHNETVVLAFYTMWIGFEMGTTILETPIRKDMLFHHIFTIICVLVGWQQSAQCPTYAIVRATLLCEPAVDLYFLFKNTQVHAVTDTLLFVLFPYTRTYLMFYNVVYPLLFESAVNTDAPSQFMGAGVVMLIYGMQWMWSIKIIKGGLAKLIK